MFSIVPPRVAVREILSFGRKEGLSWFTLGMKTPVSVWVSFNVKLEKRMWVLSLGSDARRQE